MTLTRTPSGRIRARGLGIPLQGVPGPENAITDVAGVRVGYCTRIEGTSIRTGVTAILPRAPADMSTPVWAGFHALNGNGEMTGCHWIEETGRCEGPITLTNTHSVGVVHDAAIRWMVEGHGLGQWALPVTGETYDGFLNDINGFHIETEHALAAIESAADGAVDEGSVGGGTGMVCYGYKGGSGTASRCVDVDGPVTVGAFVQANFGRREQLLVAGVPVGRLLAEDLVHDGAGSIIAILATDAPLLPHQLKRLARRAGLGVGRSGAIAGHGSGDIFLAFSTANERALQDNGRSSADCLADAALNPVFEAVIQAVDEAILNALIANDDMSGHEGRTVEALPHDQVMDALRSWRAAGPGAGG